AGRPAGRRPAAAAGGLPRSHRAVPPGGAEVPGGRPPHGPHRGQRQEPVGAGTGQAAPRAGGGAMSPEQTRPDDDAAAPPSGEARLAQALEEYRTLLDGGVRPDRQTFLARYADLGVSLAECLDGLEFVHAVAPALSGAGPAADPSDGVRPSALLG